VLPKAFASPRHCQCKSVKGMAPILTPYLEDHGKAMCTSPSTGELTRT
jgi:hypothetical protein